MSCHEDPTPIMADGATITFFCVEVSVCLGTNVCARSYEFDGWRKKFERNEVCSYGSWRIN